MEIKDREKHEATFRGKLHKLSVKHRRELLTLLGNPPSIDNVPASFWERVQREQEAELIASLLLIYIAAGTQLGLTDSQAQAVATPRAQARARSISNEFVENSRQQLRKHSELWRLKIQKAQAELNQAGQRPTPQKPPVTKGDVIEKVSSVFGKDRAARMATTDTTRTRSDAAETIMKATNRESEGDLWRTRPGLSMTGPCPICRPLNGQPRSVWSAQFPSGPPAHDNCVCDIVYDNLDDDEFESFIDDDGLPIAPLAGASPLDAI